MTASSRDFATEANLNALFWPADPEDPTSLPSIQVGGVQVFVYVDPCSASLRVSVHLDETAPELLTEKETVAMQIKVGDDDVFVAH
ncbi:hypothetical protein [Streptomyces melanosporofaciens]|uniref:Uncharacterized protein n=1 Tax=Streptomyces melanosporofaciens TaxID=67327 RepID=A0A1H4KQI2_STRMJ|nr:hypothetical protein [Streptomyces melanosporofaciens]SEB60348.1 hypothetical protein SAMN04490356_0882 [Streptomyces melanosporofaciens]